MLNEFSEFIISAVYRDNSTITFTLIAKAICHVAILLEKGQELAELSSAEFKLQLRSLEKSHSCFNLQLGVTGILACDIAWHNAHHAVTYELSNFLLKPTFS